MADINFLERELLKKTIEDSFFLYHFPDDPYVYLVAQGPCRGQKVPSICEELLSKLKVFFFIVQ